jgi:hypothetical protein
MTSNDQSWLRRPAVQWPKDDGRLAIVRVVGDRHVASVLPVPSDYLRIPSLHS